MGFRINYSKVISQADSIADCAKELSTQSSQLFTMEQTIQSAWKGEASGAFLSRVITLRGEVDATRRQIDDLATTIKDCAKVIQRAEEEAERNAAALKR